jgi:hypothetical protein
LSSLPAAIAASHSARSSIDEISAPAAKGGFMLMVSAGRAVLARRT